MCRVTANLSVNTKSLNLAPFAFCNDLTKLKKLLDDGVITQQEFQREKDKVLAKP